MVVMMLLLSLASHHGASATVLSQYENATVNAWYRGLSSDDQSALGWNISDSMCTYSGLQCNGNGEITNWVVTGLSDPLPAFLGNFTSVVFITAGGSSYVPIPDEIYTMTNLQTLYVIAAFGSASNATIPTEVGLLTNLKFFNILYNGMMGTIPTEVGLLTNLTSMSLLFNQLTGTIPTEFGKLSLLNNLALVNSQLSGTVPTEFSTASHLSSLGLDANQLTGTIPTEFGKNSHLTSLSMSHNQLVGTIPTQLANLTEFNYLDLSHNSLTGTYPSALFNPLIQNSVATLNNNNLYGPIPDLSNDLYGFTAHFASNPDMCIIPNAGYSGVSFDQSAPVCVYCIGEDPTTSTITATTTATAHVTTTITTTQASATITITTSGPPPPACTAVVSSYISNKCPGVLPTPA